jgi:hypothetical protein
MDGNEEMFVCAQLDGILRGKIGATGRGQWLAIGAWILRPLKGIDMSELGDSP